MAATWPGEGDSERSARRRDDLENTHTEKMDFKIVELRPTSQALTRRGKGLCSLLGV